MSKYYYLTDRAHRGLYVESTKDENYLLMVKNGELLRSTEYSMSHYHYRDTPCYDEYRAVEKIPEDYVSTMESLLEKAEAMAKKAHEGQVDKNGEAYFNHVKRVAEGVSFTEEKIIAYLHDTLEDTSLTEKDLAEVFPTFIVETVKTLSRDKDLESYEDFIKRVCLEDLAVPIKISDLKDNLRRTMKNPEERLKKRYEWALDFLSY